MSGKALFDAIASSGIWSAGVPPEDYPAYIKDAHELLMEKVLGDYDDGYAGDGILALQMAEPNPYASAKAVDPRSYVSRVEGAVDLYSNDVATLDPEDAWGRYMELSMEKAQKVLPSTKEISAEVAGYRDKMLPGLMQSVGRFAGAMSELNATMSSSYIMGLAMMERGFNTDVADYAAKLEAQTHRDTAAMAVQGASLMAEMLFRTEDLRRTAVGMEIDAAKVGITALREYQQDKLTYDVEKRMWDFQLVHAGANMIGAIGGTALIPKAPNPLGAMLSGSMTGAATGIGTTAFSGNPGIIAAGGLAGALLGGFGGYLQTV